MRIYLYFVFLVNHYIYCSDDSQTAEDNWLEHSLSGISHRDYENNKPDGIGRPCSVHDLDCIRHFFAHNFMCSPVYGPVPDPYILKDIHLNLAHCNITFKLKDPRIKALNSGKILEFFINKKTATLVLEVEFEKLVVETPNAVAVYHRKGKEPFELTSDSYVEFYHISLTLNIQNFGDVNHSRSHVYTYFSNDKPFLRIGDGITGTKDPQLIRMNKKWMGEVSLSAMEAFVVQGPIYMAAYLNSMICDFIHI